MNQNSKLKYIVLKKSQGVKHRCLHFKIYTRSTQDEVLKLWFFIKTIAEFFNSRAQTWRGLSCFLSQSFKVTWHLKWYLNKAQYF